MGTEKIIRDMEDVQVVEKGWESERVFINEEYCGKTLSFRPGWASSKHFHIEKDETMVVFIGRVWAEIWENGVTNSPTLLELGGDNTKYLQRKTQNPFLYGLQFLLHHPLLPQRW